MKKSFSLYLLLALIFVSAYFMLPSSQPTKRIDPPVAASQPATKFYLDPRIKALGDQIGIPENVLIAFNVQPGTQNECAGSDAAEFSTVTACYYPALHIIYIVDFSGDPATARGYLAYELLHAVWDQAPETTKANLRPLLTQVYNNNPKIQAHMRGFKVVVGDETFFNELHSIAGSQTNDKELPKPLLDYYKQWFPNRNALPSTF